jgi:hypothetical protein
MNSRSELLAYIATTIATVVGLFVLQAWYASYLDVAVVHGDEMRDAPANPKVLATREQEQAKLAASKLSIDAAKRLIAERGRQSAPAVTPQPSDDLSAMSGWVFRPGFKPYEPRGTAAGTPAPAEQAGAVAPAGEPAP